MVASKRDGLAIRNGYLVAHEKVKKAMGYMHHVFRGIDTADWLEAGLRELVNLPIQKLEKVLRFLVQPTTLDGN